MKQTRLYVLLGLTLALVSPCVATNPNHPSLRDFELLLAQHPVEGMPLSRFEDFRQTPGASEFAGRLLSEENNARHWSNAVRALGVLGDRKAKEIIDAFLRNAIDPLTGTNRLSRTTFNAKVDCLFALGYMALHSPDGTVKAEAKAFLDEANGPSAQIWRELTWQSPLHDSIVARNNYLVGTVRLVNQTIAKESATKTHHNPTMARAKD